LRGSIAIALFSAMIASGVFAGVYDKDFAYSLPDGEICVSSGLAKLIGTLWHSATVSLSKAKVVRNVSRRSRQ